MGRFMVRVADRSVAVRQANGTAELLVAPRLLSLRQAAAYLGCSYWSVRDYALSGRLPVVTLPPLRAREGERPKDSLRRTLIDVRDLDGFVERCKAGNDGVPHRIANPVRPKTAP
jgi:hypothetical protein